MNLAEVNRRSFLKGLFATPLVLAVERVLPAPMPEPAIELKRLMPMTEFPLYNSMPEAEPQWAQLFQVYLRAPKPGCSVRIENIGIDEWSPL